MLEAGNETLFRGTKRPNDLNCSFSTPAQMQFLQGVNILSEVVKSTQ